VLDVRRAVEGLRPPELDELGLAGAVEQSVHGLTAGAGLRVDVSIALLPPLPAAAEVAAFRIITEAVTNVVRHADGTSPFAGLTDREVDVLELIGEGRSNQQIARALGLSVKTVQDYVSRILDRLQVRDRTQAALRVRDEPGFPRVTP
jgi:DNA-binding NarL/FixJ family response regulator